MNRSEGWLPINLDCLLGGLLIKAVIYRVKKKERKRNKTEPQNRPENKAEHVEKK